MTGSLLMEETHEGLVLGHDSQVGLPSSSRSGPHDQKPTFVPTAF